jgi:predicted ester cyclase
MIDRTLSRYFEDVWNAGHVDALDDLLTADYVNHSPAIPNPPPGPEGLKPIVRAMRAAIPDLHYTILDLVIGDRKAAVYVQVTGTQVGPLFGLPPTGKPFELRQMQIEWFKGERIWQHWRITGSPDGR